ncbi:phosphatidylserine decarboxylase related protein [Leadbetterella byssophila DSM 17132]|uniref:Phosphatidylserine decarboxylase proenzyme n=1 Tax=Leadbetterella byssophila (strain DSM 17132 / JCM 16389 / KACC 11308 / NBRC 106382 / 4M15) TaxID=649349 RepID=E4RVR5_LEAB4|nr:phosphatidylserine decarboxylase family protein [Leadbetterella byssophila]ADQ17963.1 phosphatidylserine decarboxylase related protein [Leadbetterella byssophila DSM 17132]
MTIHKEGTGTLLITIIALAAINAIAWFYASDLVQNILWIFSALFFLIVLQFFRKPTRKTPINPQHIIAPADGKVVVIEEVMETEYFNDKRIQVSIFMSPLNVHINFNPLSGIVSYFKYHPGKYLVAWHPKSSTDNERTTIVTKHENGTEVLFRQIAGALARRICWYVDKGTVVTQGQEFGFIKFGSRIDLYLPLDAKINVKIGDKPVGGETVIAELC